MHPELLLPFQQHPAVRLLGAGQLLEEGERDHRGEPGEGRGEAPGGHREAPGGHREARDQRVPG